MLKEKLLEDLKESMKEKNVIRKNVVQMVRAAILQIEKDKKIVPKIKVSENTAKVTNPSVKKVYRFYDNETKKAIYEKRFILYSDGGVLRTVLLVVCEGRVGGEGWGGRKSAGTSCIVSFGEFFQNG